jgi:hypothetical protein
MYCTKCGKANAEGAAFCSSCGQPLTAVNNQSAMPITPSFQSAPVGQSTPVVSNQVDSNTGLGKVQKGIILGLLLLVIVLLGTAVVTTLNGGTKKKDGSQTIMIYLDGSNLESEGSIVTAELDAINPDKIDLEKTHIILYTGGTTEWHNFISNDENAIYELTEDGFEKVKTFDKDNMGSAKTLSTFLNYSYDNYKAGHYSLVLYDHGAAIYGAIFDDFTNDNLSLEEFSTALNGSPFNSKNKLDAVIFRTCLNGTLEVANTFKDYSEYITFSEEVTWGSSQTNILGNFLNGLDPSSNGLELGKKFIDAYKEQMKTIDPLDEKCTTYSIIDLSKIDKVNEELNKYIEGVDIKKNYSEISRLRNTMYQYGADASMYDTVDLYSLATKLEPYSSNKIDSLEKALNDAIIYNYSNHEKSNGLSVYFPYNGKDNEKKVMLQIYNNFDSLKNYRTFINSFNGAISGAQSYNFDFTKNETNVESSGKEITIQLTKEQQERYSSSTYILFQRDAEHPNYYRIIYNANDTKLSKDGKLTTNIGNNLVREVEKKGEVPATFTITYREKDGKSTRKSTGILYDYDKGMLGTSAAINLNISYKGDEPIISGGEKISRDQRLDGIAYDISKYTGLAIPAYEYKILDDKGNVLPTSEWESIPTQDVYLIKMKDLKLERFSLDKAKGEYYVLFNIIDINKEGKFSKLVKVGE